MDNDTLKRGLLAAAEAAEKWRRIGDEPPARAFELVTGVLLFTAIDELKKVYPDYVSALRRDRRGSEVAIAFRKAAEELDEQ